MTNTLKHAFPDGRRGSIRVAFARDGLGTGTFVIADDGIGMAVPADWAGGTVAPADGAATAPRPGTAGLGLRLIEALAQQVDGQVRIVGARGTVISVTMPCPDAEPGTSTLRAAPPPAAPTAPPATHPPRDGNGPGKPADVRRAS